ncbi:histidine phosphatase family protein [Limnobacter sp.]|uniref:histidine phosphatase family protein n=1 Tax=Limnobacter sp. TaxID=2003368 RepID=UPI002736738F|nr:histidine phosphatase family protein [Limnobacter sp.]MDP3188950.1 histidine phosphatase family protein [Limnobacter sp.]
MKLWLIRHAPVLLPAGICYGASDVLADDDASLQAAREAAAQLPAGLPARVSGLKRAQQLAKHLAVLRPDLPAAIVDPRLNEMNFGCWEMQAWNTVPQAAFDAWLADFDHHCFGGVESTHRVLQRVGQALKGMQSDELWITHAGVVRAVQWIVEHGSAPVQQAADWPATVVEPGGLLTLKISAPD